MMHVLREEGKKGEIGHNQREKQSERISNSAGQSIFFLSLLYSAENGFTKIYTLLKNPCHPPRSSISLTHTLAHTHAHTHAGIRLWNPPFSPFRPSSLFLPSPTLLILCVGILASGQELFAIKLSFKRSWMCHGVWIGGGSERESVEKRRHCEKTSLQSFDSLHLTLLRIDHADD